MLLFAEVVILEVVVPKTAEVPVVQNDVFGNLFGVAGIAVRPAGGHKCRSSYRSVPEYYILSTVTAITIGAVRSGPLTSSIVSITSRFFGVTVTSRIC